VKGLSIDNHQSQMNNNQQWSIIQYSHLTEVDLTSAHEDYVEQFLNNTKTYLLYDICLHTNYDRLKTVTNNFTRDSTKFNCQKIRNLALKNKPDVVSLNVTDYFPFAKIFGIL